MSGQNNKIGNYMKALESLKNGLEQYDGISDLARDGLIQRFEYTFELAWKTLKHRFESEGLLGLNSPKNVLREAYSALLIKDEEVWLAMLKDRNTTAHMYNKQLAEEICNNIKAIYLPAFEKLAENLIEDIT